MVVNTPSSWEELEPAVIGALQQLKWHLQESKEPEIQLAMALPGIQGQIDHVCDQIQRTLESRGRSYGEDVLFLLGEMGFVAWAVSKALRLLWSYTQGFGSAARDDDWLDLAGYPVLRMAIRRWEVQNGRR